MREGGPAVNNERRLDAIEKQLHGSRHRGSLHEELAKLRRLTDREFLEHLRTEAAEAAKDGDAELAAEWLNMVHQLEELEQRKVAASPPQESPLAGHLPPHLLGPTS